MDKGHNKIYALMTIGVVFWAGAFIAGKVGVQEFSPVSLTFLRFFFASIIIFFVMVKYEKKDWRIGWNDLGVMLALGIVGMVGYHVLFFAALQYTKASNASMLAAINPLLTAILASLFIGEKLGIKRLGAIFLALFGVILTITNWNITSLTNLTFNKGDLIMLLAVSCWAVYSIIVKKVMPRYSPLILSTYSFIVCTVVLLPFVIAEGLFQQLPTISFEAWTSVLYMAIFPTVIGYLIQQVSIKEIGPSRTAIFINLVPICSVILAAIILHEDIVPLNLLSGFIIIAGVYLNSRIKTEGQILKQHS